MGLRSWLRRGANASVEARAGSPGAYVHDRYERLILCDLATNGGTATMARVLGLLDQQIPADLDPHSAEAVPASLTADVAAAVRRLTARGFTARGFTAPVTGGGWRITERGKAATVLDLLGVLGLPSRSAPRLRARLNTR
ncbi:hypothetical protein OHB26_39365 (plasmid) [Nocardia sp. NBC_01503]|uniref:hypothetical protein n=1 Tax=Nocardia sp. NBC_01503 TaxID=2975997 RepID=UPI002E7ADB73|nr:hypothetical protein [Nocardia sp. NBC_01503]WTL36708.1 hypothetical protein OHB26_39210 [Nocardia sp. NBC_01503]WTL36739.1 hypothetical protein OHB26_39365 [Nocardia sp. NBC_01503]